MIAARLKNKLVYNKTQHICPWCYADYIFLQKSLVSRCNGLEFDKEEEQTLNVLDKEPSLLPTKICIVLQG